MRIRISPELFVALQRMTNPAWGGVCPKLLSLLEQEIQGVLHAAKIFANVCQDRLDLVQMSLDRYIAKFPPTRTFFVSHERENIMVNNLDLARGMSRRRTMQRDSRGPRRSQRPLAA